MYLFNYDREMIEIEKQKLEDERLKQQKEEERQREDARFRMAQVWYQWKYLILRS